MFNTPAILIGFLIAVYYAKVDAWLKVSIGVILIVLGYFHIL